MGPSGTYVRITPGEEGPDSEWDAEPAAIHIHNYRYDDYGTEVVSIDTEYEHRPYMRELDWETTHRNWIGHAWKVDFDALDMVVHHLVTRGFPLTMEPDILRIYLTDYDGPFLKSLAPDGPTPGGSPAHGEGQMELTDFGQ